MVQEFGHRHIFDIEESDTNHPIHEQVQMRCQEAYQEESTSTRDGTVGDIDPDMDFMHIEDEPGSPISRDLENMHRHQHTVQGDEIDGQYEDEDDTFLEYHSQDEDDSDDDKPLHFWSNL